MNNRMDVNLHSSTVYLLLYNCHINIDLTPGVCEPCGRTRILGDILGPVVPVVQTPFQLGDVHLLPSEKLSITLFDLRMTTQPSNN